MRNGIKSGAAAGVMLLALGTSLSAQALTRPVPPAPADSTCVAETRALGDSTRWGPTFKPCFPAWKAPVARDTTCVTMGPDSTHYLSGDSAERSGAVADSAAPGTRRVRVLPPCTPVRPDGGGLKM